MTSNKQPVMGVTPPESRLPILEKVSFASGAIPYGVGYFIIMQLAYPVLNISMGISATAIGLVLAFGRLWDAVTDPLVGWMSDNSRSRWGRRKPFLLIGTLILAVSTPMLWGMSPDWPVWAQLVWFSAVGFLFYLGSTLFCVPWLSMSYEMTPDPAERTRLHAYRAYAGTAIGLTFPWMFRWTQADIFPNILEGTRWVSVGAGLACVLFTLPILFFCRERADHKLVHQKKITFFASLKATLSNRHFMIFEIGIVTVVLCVPMLVGSMGTYVNIYYVFGGDMKAGAAMAGLIGSLNVVVNLMVLPFAVKLASRFGKVRVMRWALTSGLIGAAFQFFLITPNYPYLQLAGIFLMTPAFTAFWLLVDPMKADCADYDESKTGLRREGSYASVANWIEKLFVTLTLALSGIVLDLSGFDPGLEAGQSSETLFYLRFFVCFGPALAFAIALVALRYYGLNDELMNALRSRLRTAGKEDAAVTS